MGRRPARLLLGVGLLLVVGCSAAPPEFGEVRGKVTLSGKPLAGIVVTFYPATEGNEGLPAASGKTDATGTYALATASGQPGAVVGKHRVVVSWPAPERPANWEKGVPSPRPPGPLIPLKYTVALDTPLVFEVKPGPQTIDLPLER